jgi:hypothetical protein
MIKLLRLLFGKKEIKKEKVLINEKDFVSLNPQNDYKRFDYILTYEEGIIEFNKLQIGKEYELLNLVTKEWKKQKYMPPNEQETFEKMMHGIRYGWIKP